MSNWRSQSARDIVIRRSSLWINHIGVLVAPCSHTCLFDSIDSIDIGRHKCNWLYFVGFSGERTLFGDNHGISAGIIGVIFKTNTQNTATKWTTPLITLHHILR